MRIGYYFYRLVFFFISVLSLTSVSAQINQVTVEQYLSASQKAGLKPNRLITEGSPYLLQHAYNPVQWYAWGEAAFKKARKENKPIFLSIGYSTCHWCHVMEHESFENKQVAKILNENYISIKVDREERPDIDSVYMAATQLINGHGGWPMTVFLNNELEPFHAGTYYPRESTAGRRGLIDLLDVINKLWREDRKRIDNLAAVVTEKIKAEKNIRSSGSKFLPEIDHLIFEQITQSFDSEYGGFGDAPKFPRVGIFSYLMAVINDDSENNTDKKIEARLILEKTLDEMAYGGIYDQVGGGFHRYSVDVQWQVPHFEKMLYSQALMTLAYVHLYDVTKKPLYENVIRNTLSFVANEMTHPQGGFYSALDADSAIPENPDRKAEGAYYLWLQSDIKRLLTEEERKLISAYFDIQKNGNIDSDPQNEFAQKNIFYISEDFRAKTLDKKQQHLLNSAFKKLNKERIKRPRPHLDDKIITAWNGMMISAYAKAYQVFGETQYLETALKAARFIEKNLLDSKAFTLKRRSRAGLASIDSGLSDYVWFVRGLIDLYRASEDKHWLTLAISLQKKQNQLFYDETSAAYFDSSGADSSILFRSKSIYDGALPAVNAIAIENLFELSKLAKNKQWKLTAHESLKVFAAVANASPTACASLLAVRLKRVHP